MPIKNGDPPTGFGAYPSVAQTRPDNVPPSTDGKIRTGSQSLTQGNWRSPPETAADTLPPFPVAPPSTAIPLATSMSPLGPQAASPLDRQVQLAQNVADPASGRPATTPAKPASDKDTVLGNIQKLFAKKDPPPAPPKFPEPGPADIGGIVAKSSGAPFPTAATPSGVTQTSGAVPGTGPLSPSSSPVQTPKVVGYTTVVPLNLPDPPPLTSPPPAAVASVPLPPAGSLPDVPPSRLSSSPTPTIKSPPQTSMPVAQVTPPPKKDWRNEWGQAGNGREDPALNPGRFDPPQKPVPPAASIAVKKETSEKPTMPAKAVSTPVQTAQPSSPSYLPPGSGSVVAANSGMRMTYVPVPTMSIPPSFPQQNQAPPAPKIPPPPQAPAFVNAFTPPVQARNPSGVEGAMFTTEQLRNPILLAQLQATNPYLANPAMMQYAMQNMNQLPPPQQQLLQQAIYVQQQQSMMQPQRPVLPTNYPANYQGPLPPNPFVGANQPGWSLAQAHYQQPGYAPYPQYQQYPQQYQPYAQPYPQQYQQYYQPQVQQPQNAQQVGKILIESEFPAQREWAAATLGYYEYRGNPQVVPLLILAAERDKSALVRAACVNSLSRLNVSNASVRAALEKLKHDPDVRVQSEVRQAQCQLKLDSK